MSLAVAVFILAGVAVASVVLPIVPVGIAIAPPVSHW